MVDATQLAPNHELFSAAVASGRSYRAAAKIAGFDENYGFRLMKIPAIRQRVEELLQEPAERIRAGLESELLMLRHRAAESELSADERANVELRLKLVLAHGRLRGWIVDKKQINKATLDLSKLLAREAGTLGRAQLRQAFEEHLNQLDPGSRSRLRAIASGADESETVEANE